MLTLFQHLISQRNQTCLLISTWAWKDCRNLLPHKSSVTPICGSTLSRMTTDLRKPLNSRLDRTCQWISDHASYLSWASRPFEDQNTKVLWIHGPAGFGKTALLASIIKHMKEKSGLPLAYCFSSSHAQNTPDLNGIVRTWITQLIREDNTILSLTNRMRQKCNTRRASRDDIWALLREISLQVHSCFLFLDGLDEIQNVDYSRRDFFGDLKKATQATRLLICITSRTESDIESVMLSEPKDSPNYIILDCKVSRKEVEGDINLLSESIVARKLPSKKIFCDKNSRGTWRTDATANFYGSDYSKISCETAEARKLYER